MTINATAVHDGLISSKHLITLPLRCPMLKTAIIASSSKCQGVLTYAKVQQLISVCTLLEVLILNNCLRSELADADMEQLFSMGQHLKTFTCSAIERRKDDDEEDEEGDDDDEPDEDD